jgi:hypothetical protein
MTTACKECARCASIHTNHHTTFRFFSLLNVTIQQNMTIACKECASILTVYPMMDSHLSARRIAHNSGQAFFASIHTHTHRNQATWIKSINIGCMHSIKDEVMTWERCRPEKYDFKRGNNFFSQAFSSLKCFLTPLTVGRKGGTRNALHSPSTSRMRKGAWHSTTQVHQPPANEADTLWLKGMSTGSRDEP